MIQNQEPTGPWWELTFVECPFPGTNRFVEIAVRPAGNGTFTALAPRQQISSSPYAIRTLSAASADALSSACVGCVQDSQIQGIAGSKVTGTIPAASVPTGSGNYIQNRNTPQAGASFNVAGTGTVGGVLSAGSVGIGTAAPATGVLLEINGPTRLTPGGSGGFVQLGTPGGESGLSISGATSRADLRFNDATLKLVAGPGAGPPGATSGLSITTAGVVGIGTATPTTGKPHVVSDASVPAIYAESANRGVWGRSTGSSRGVYDDSVSGEGMHGESVSGTGVAGVSHGPDGVAVVGANDTGGTGVLGQSFGGFNTGFAMVADGHAKQTRDKGGWLKAMASISESGSILRCYNSQNPVLHATGDCDITVEHPAAGFYIVNFGFNVADRFASVTAVQTDILFYPSGYLFPVDDPTALGNRAPRHRRHQRREGDAHQRRLHDLCLLIC